MIETPKNLTKNILLGMFFGLLFGAVIFYLDPLPEYLTFLIGTYLFNLGGDIFINLLKLMIVPLVFFSLVTGISSLGSLKSLGNITLKTIGLYLTTTAIAVSLSLLVGSIFRPGSGYSSDLSVSPDSLPEGQGT